MSNYKIKSIKQTSLQIKAVWGERKVITTASIDISYDNAKPETYHIEFTRNMLNGGATILVVGLPEETTENTLSVDGVTELVLEQLNKQV